MNAKIKIRARIIMTVSFLLGMVLICTLYWLQVVNGETYAKKAESQYVETGTKMLNRGSIFLSAKDGTKVQGATLKSGYKVYINPSVIPDPKVVFEALSDYVDLDEAEFMKKATKPNDKYEELVSQVPEEKAISIRNLKIIGLGVTKEIWRIYPGEGMLAHELGLLGESASSSVVVGKYGLERSYENVLKRTKSTSGGYVFAQLFGDENDEEGANKNTADKNGANNSEKNQLESKEGDIITTIEPTVQKYLEKILEQTQNKWQPEIVGGVVIDPNNGEILAMSSLPSFNPNDTRSVKNVRVFSNPLIENAYEMGSIIKPLTMATALDYGAVTPTSTYEDTGFLTLSGKKIANHDNKARGKTTMQDLLSYSLNVGAATIALKVGKEDFSKYFFSYGISMTNDRRLLCG
jgi:cell division protein FtsI/penicillin-binding protein 2